jgi:hypothetical protein
MNNKMYTFLEASLLKHKKMIADVHVLGLLMTKKSDALVGRV